jgi:FlaA1/EpsC-like NDP-sugar epimerase
MDRLKPFLVGLTKGQKRLIQVVVDIVLVWGALWLAFIVRLGLGDVFGPFNRYDWLFVFAPIVSIPVFIKMGMYRAVMRYFGNDALITIIKAVTISSLLLVALVYIGTANNITVPRSVIFNYWILCLVFIGGLRLCMRQYFMGDWFSVPPEESPDTFGTGETRVAIYGAGVAGNQLVAALRMGRRMRPVAFVDDEPSISNRSIAGLHVYKSCHIQKMIDDTGAQEVLLALPSSTRSKRREILSLLEAYPLHVRSVPSFSDLASGRVKVDDIREVDIADLLGRDAVPANPELLQGCVTGKVVMVTGAGGSIGSELCRQILALEPLVLILYEHSEFNLYSINNELERLVQCKASSVILAPILGSVRDQKKLLNIMSAWKVQTVYHAAAYKQVPMVEQNIAEGVLNNVMGTLYAAQAALCAGVKNFVLISTDKAVRPTNIMGSTKRLAEMILQALSREIAPSMYGDAENVSHVNKTRFTMVRFGNVLGSSGSVIPLFRQQIKSGGPVTVTHPEITRYFMTIPEAAQLVIQAGSMGRGGDVFVLDMGEPIKIVSLAEKMIHFSGLSVRNSINPSGDIVIEYTGLRPGEKLYEELLIGEDVAGTEHPMIMKANEEYLSWDLFKCRLSELLEAVESDNYVNLREVLTATVEGYKPEDNVVDWSYRKDMFDKECS